MEHNDKVKVIKFIRPNAEFYLSNDILTWLDTSQIKPTESEIEAGWVAYQASQAAEAETKATAKAALLAQLGITEEQAKLLLS
jgi:hypothetical protein